MDMTDDLLTPQALVVAKDSDDVKELLAALDSWGFKTVWAKDGEAGYNVLDGPEVLDALITELNVQRIDGMRLLSVAKQRNPEICVIMIASDADIELATEAMRQGAYDFQTKPLNLKKEENWNQCQHTRIRKKNQICSQHPRHSPTRPHHRNP